MYRKVGDNKTFMVQRQMVVHRLRQYPVLAVEEKYKQEDDGGETSKLDACADL